MLRLLAGLLGLVLSVGIHAMEFDGIAPVGMEGAESAREAAIKDALENASLGQGAEVKSATLSSSGKNADSLRIRGRKPGAYTVLREWQANGFYHVTLDVQAAATEAEGVGSAVTAPRCIPDYRRKLLVTTLPVLNPVQLTDLPRFPEAMQAELARRLEGSDRFLSQVSNNESAIISQAGRLEPEWNPDWLRDLARRYGVQFIVGGIIRDVGVEGERYEFTYGNDVRPGERKRELALPWLGLGKPGIKSTPMYRHFELDLFVFDGVSGARISRHRIAGKASSHIIKGGEMLFDPQGTSGTETFFSSPFGKLVANKLDEAVGAIASDVQCIPFSSRITRVESGRVYIDAGATSKLKPGDRLQVYRLRPGARAIDAIGQPGQLGWPEELAGSITIKDVQPLFSSAQSEAAIHAEVGDYVRFMTKEGTR